MKTTRYNNGNMLVEERTRKSERVDARETTNPESRRGVGLWWTDSHLPSVVVHEAADGQDAVGADLAAVGAAHGEELAPLSTQPCEQVRGNKTDARPATNSEIRGASVPEEGFDKDTVRTM